MRTQKEINDEIEALQRLCPIGPWKSQTTRNINFAIEALRDGFDTTAAEFEELLEDQQETVIQALGWKNGECECRPSTGWGKLVA